MASKHFSLPKECDSVITRSSPSDYRGKCAPHPEGGRFADKDSPFPNQIHHILCQDAIADIDVGDEELIYLQSCLCATDYNINDKNNLIGLPTRGAYTRSRGFRPKNLPCHTIDHPMYTVEVKKWLHKKIWNKLRAKKGTHKVTPENIQAKLRACSKHFRTQLRNRGKRPSGRGTEWGWENRRVKSHSKTWYRPFSMAANPRRRSAGTDGLNIFALIK